VVDQLPTKVDVFQLQQAVQWLQDTKNFIDQKILVAMRQIPGIINAPGAPKQDNMPDVSAMPSTASLTGNTVTGQIAQASPSHFGTFPNGNAVANKHGQAYNNALGTLDSISKDLAKAIEGTKYIVEHYQNTEDVNAQELSRVMADPPYMPSEPPPVQTTGAHHPGRNFE